MYHLQVNIDVNEDSPEKYTKLVSDKLLSYTLTPFSKHIHLSYKAHSIPYTISMSPATSCIQYGYSLPI